MTMALLPASIDAFEAANIMARITGYVAKRYVDIGDQVKAEQLLAEISAPELDHQVAQAQATLALRQAALNQEDSLVGCTVRDFSPAGVGLLVPIAIVLPIEFDLTFNHAVQHCITVWRQPERTGLKFQSPE